MCLICKIGEGAAIQGTEDIARIVLEAVTFPLAPKEARNRIIQAFAEVILALNQCYRIELAEGVTEDEARKGFTETFDKALKEREEQVKELSKTLGVPFTSLEEMEVFAKAHGDKDDILNKEYIN